jgi:hypothetical protein
MLVWELQLELQRRRASTKGKRADLLARLTTMVLAEQPGSADVEEDNSDEDDVEEGGSEHDSPGTASSNRRCT